MGRPYKGDCAGNSGANGLNPQPDIKFNIQPAENFQRKQLWQSWLKNYPKQRLASENQKLGKSIMSELGVTRL